MYACYRRPWQLKSRSLHSKAPILEPRACDHAPAKSRPPTCRSTRLSRVSSMRGRGEDVILARRCDECVFSTALTALVT